MVPSCGKSQDCGAVTVSVQKVAEGKRWNLEAHDVDRERFELPARKCPGSVTRTLADILAFDDDIVARYPTTSLPQQQSGLMV